MKCKNCHSPLNFESDYCHACGGKVIRNRLNFKNLFEHISETFFNYDNTVLRTLIDLFRRPEQVIQPYIDGVRKRYVNPVSYFALALTISGLYLLVLKKFYPETMDFSFISAPGQEEFQRKNLSFVQEYQSLIMMFYIPIYAFMARISFLGLPKFNYTELLVIFMYLQAQISIVRAIVVLMACVFGLRGDVLSLLLLPVMVFYVAFCLRRLYGLSLGQMFLRSLLFLAIFGILFLTASIIVGIIMYLNGDYEQLKQAGKTAYSFQTHALFYS